MSAELAFNRSVDVDYGVPEDVAPGVRRIVFCEVRKKEGAGYEEARLAEVSTIPDVRILEEARIAAFGPPRGPGLPGIEPPVALFSVTVTVCEPPVSEKLFKGKEA